MESLRLSDQVGPGPNSKTYSARDFTPPAYEPLPSVSRFRRVVGRGFLRVPRPRCVCEGGGAPLQIFVSSLTLARRRMRALLGARAKKDAGSCGCLSFLLISCQFPDFGASLGGGVSRLFGDRMFSESSSSLAPAGGVSEPCSTTSLASTFLP